MAQASTNFWTKYPPVKTFLITLLIQTFYLPFVFWFVELGQNKFTKLVTGEYGWYYPASPYYYFYFQSLLSWLTCVVVFWSLYYWVFIPRCVGFWKRIAVTTVVGWASEWLFGFLAPFLLGHWMQIWPKSPLRFVSVAALGWWFTNSLIFYMLVIYIPKAVGNIIHQYELVAGQELKRK